LNIHFGKWIVNVDTVSKSASLYWLVRGRAMVTFFILGC
jgi:hypothetical protein